MWEKDEHENMSILLSVFSEFSRCDVIKNSGMFDSEEIKAVRIVTEILSVGILATWTLTRHLKYWSLRDMLPWCLGFAKGYHSSGGPGQPWLVGSEILEGSLSMPRRIWVKSMVMLMEGGWCPVLMLGCWWDWKHNRNTKICTYFILWKQDYEVVIVKSFLN